MNCNTNNNITKKAIKLIKQGVSSSLIKDIDNINNLTIEDICNAAKNGDEMSITVLKEAARYIGIAITNLINILNPTAIVVVRIIRSLLGRDASVIGAATLVIQEIFNGINKN